jgi:hypothetical protein
MFKRLGVVVALQLGLVAVVPAIEMTSSAEVYRAQGRTALSELVAAKKSAADASDAPRALRDRAILAVVQASTEGLAEQTLDALDGYREQHPDDLYAKMYEGYGWLFTAGEYVKKKNYFRAAELAKRGFFLMDEAVDQQPDDWRLRLLRARVDVYVPAEFGRHVVALKDLHYLEENAAQIPPELSSLVAFLQIRAFNSAGQDQRAQQLGVELGRTPLWAELLQKSEPRLFLTPDEVQYVLAEIVDAK